MANILRVVLGRGWPVGALVFVACLALGADVSADRDICGCTNNPASLGDFNTDDPSTYPPGSTRTNLNGSGIALLTIPTPANGVLIFRSFTVHGSGADRGFPPNQFGCCDFRTFLRFTRNAANSPITILVTGDMNIDGAGQVGVPGDDATNGSNGINGLGGLGGPGGFRGGDGAYQLVNLAADGGPGFGPGGGAPGPGIPGQSARGADGSFIGIPELLPLVGGSGGGGGGSTSNSLGCSAGGGGGGGGGILMAVNGTLTVNGVIVADGGTPGDPGTFNCADRGGMGSGGAIRLLANNINGNGLILARTGRRCLNCGDSDRPATGKGGIRLEAFTNTFPGDRTDPPASRALAPGPVTNPITPTVTITSVGGQVVPTSPQGVFGVTDLILPAPGLVAIQISASAVPGGTTIQVTVKPRVGGAAVSQTAPLGNCTSSGVCTTSTTFNLPAGEFLIEATATFQTS